MARLGSWIEPFPEGIYIKPADAWVDPSQPKARALVTHGHADHARGGHGEVWATPETLAITGGGEGGQAGGGVGQAETGRGGRGGGCGARPGPRAAVGVRSGERAGHGVAYDETVRVGEVEARFVPAGHV